MTVWMVPPPGGGAIGVSPTSGLMSSMYLATTFWAEESLGLTSASISVLGGMPRSARSMFAASRVFANQLIQAIAASGFLDLLDADHSMLALYHPLRSVALPAKLGGRSISIFCPAALLTASSWLEFWYCMAPLP